MARNDLDEGNRGVICIVFCVILFVSSFLVGFSWRILDYDMYGLKVNEISRAVTEQNTYDSGRHFLGLGNVFERFKKTSRYIVFTVEDLQTDEKKDGEDPGTAAGSTRGPITIRTKDGQRLDIEITFQYVINKDTLYTLYVTYGTEYNSIIVAIARAKVRDIGSLYGSSDYFDKRIQIEQHFKQALDVELKQRYVSMIDFQMRAVILPQDLDQELKKIQLNEIEYTLIKAQLDTDVILRETNQVITKRTSARDKKLLEDNQLVTNSIKILEKSLEFTKETTNTQVAYERAKMIAANKKFEKETAAAIAIVEGKTMLAKEETQLQVANITAQINVLNAQNVYDVNVILKNANLMKSKNISNANAQKVILESAATKAGITKFQTNAGFNADDIVTYEFSDLVGSINSNNLKMDMQKPNDLYLPGQKASQEKNLKDKYGALV